MRLKLATLKKHFTHYVKNIQLSVIIENEPPNNKLISDDYSPNEEAWTN